MRVLSGKVVGGKIVIEGESLEEGATVTVLAPDDRESFELGPEDEAALLAAIEEAERGEVLSVEEVLRDVRSRG